MTPELQGAVIGAAATAVGAVIGYLGARVQGKAALEAVRMQVRGQRFDARWQMRRDAYAAFFTAVEETRSAMAHAHAVMNVHLQQGEAADVGGGPAAARMALVEAWKGLVFQQSLLRLSVSVLERGTADSLVSQVRSVTAAMDVWWDSALRGDPAPALRARFLSRSGELDHTVEHVVQAAKGWLDGAPELDAPRVSLLRRFREWNIDRRFRRTGD
ncbi:hypothetical protein SEA_KROMP_87 [Streptomyces phage Kromp]|uniref:Uncharacterized protein n=1 Tax=Streptomyces phage Kromp TaxID=2315619 RepID=A0A386K8K2_9CAUD|nr:hypothetical protein SEA_KROMP_87 [Streptomyces phage Kromp]